MRFTSALISIVLSASTVLAQYYPFPYAGVRLVSDEVKFQQVSASFIAPQIWCYNYPGSSAYVGIGIGNSTCGIEAGTRIACTDNGDSEYRAYSQLYPYGELAYYDELNITSLTFMEVDIGVFGDGVHIQINVPGGKDTGRKYIAPGSSVEYCRKTVSWFLRANIKNGKLQEMPQFDWISLLETMAYDDATFEYGPKSEGAQRMLMKDFNGRTPAMGVASSNTSVVIR